VARIRTYKPEFWTDSKTGTLTDRATKLLLGIMSHCDDWGVIEDDLGAIKARVFPYIHEAPEACLATSRQELLDRGLLVLFKWVPRPGHPARSYLFIRNFAKHQRVDRPGIPLIPDFMPEAVEARIAEEPGLFEGSGAGAVIPIFEGPFASVREPSRTFALEGKGKEGKGEEGRTDGAPSPAGSAPPPLLVFPVIGKGAKEWGFTEAALKALEADFPGLAVLAEVKKAHAWAQANPGRRKTASGMPRFLVNWLSKAANSYRGPGAGGGVVRQAGAAAPVAGKYAR
jgi:hypothetical protein